MERKSKKLFRNDFGDLVAEGDIGHDYFICDEWVKELLGNLYKEATLHVSGGPFLGARKVTLFTPSYSPHPHIRMGDEEIEVFEAVAYWAGYDPDVETEVYFRLDKRG